MKTAIFMAAMFCSLTAMARDDDGECQTPIVSIDERMAIQGRTARLAGFSDKVPESVAALLTGVPQLWTCSKDSKAHCCNKIPVDVSTDGAACFVTLPYGKLAVSTDRGTKKPRVVWELRVERSAEFIFPNGFAFDKVTGIKLTKLPSVALPVGNGDHDGGNAKRFKLDSTGKVGDASGHAPRVYPRKADGTADVLNECAQYDPTISNTN